MACEESSVAPSPTPTALPASTPLGTPLPPDASSGGSAELDKAREQLIGRWQLQSTGGGIAGETIKPDKPTFLTFTAATMTWQAGDATQELSYRLKMGKSIYSTEQTPILVHSDGPEQVVQFHGADGLSLSDNVYDGFGQSFRRVASE